MNHFMNRKLAVLSLAAIAFTCELQSTVVEHDANAEIFLQKGRTILRYTKSGTLKVTESGTVEVLIVGGGGGGGENKSESSNQGGAGGGGGGVIYKTSFQVSASQTPYEVVVGDGGDIGENGGNSSVFGLTAYGGGAGADYTSAGVAKSGGNGGCGGGSTRGSNVTQEVMPGLAVHDDNDNIGCNGGVATHHYGAAGGGGAGGNGGNGEGSTPGIGGVGYECPILYVPFFATNTFYGGGGAGFRYNTTVAGGVGGGGSMKGTEGEAGVDGLGGGGCGGYAGGSGVVIISFTRTTASWERGWFAGTGGDASLIARGANGREEVLVFRNSGTLTLEGSGTVDILAVGGGGGGGILASDGDVGCGGGGGGGVVYCPNLPVRAGTYSITVGKGGNVGVNGYATTGLGIFAFGGGAGGGSDGYVGVGKDGASGGGASFKNSTPGTPNAGGLAIYADYMNMGHAGAESNMKFCAGGGGGAGEEGHIGDSTSSPKMPGAGGAGYLCSITGLAEYYGGGGAGYRKTLTVSGGAGGGGSLVGGVAHAGKNGLGGGGCGGMAGGSGVFIVRYRLKPVGMVFTIR